jgi:hypothetical protein
MMELSAGYLVWAPQGGLCMVPFLASEQDQRTLVHVWAHLSADVQTRVIGLLGQLALNLVVARPVHPSESEEARRVEQTADAQNPS